MKESVHLSYFFADHATGRFTAICAPKAGAAEHNPAKANETVGSLAADNHRKQFGREGLEAESVGFVGMFKSIATCKVCNLEAVFKKEN
jgi:hypothetical protein